MSYHLTSRSYTQNGLPLRKEAEHTIHDIIRFKFPASNNQAEYEALIFGIELASFYGAKKIAAFCNSQLVVKQIKVEYNTQHPILTKYKELILEIVKRLEFFELSEIGREDNQVADVLSKLATIDVVDPDTNPLIVFVEDPSYETLRVMLLDWEKKCWIDEYIDFIEKDQQPE